MSTTPPFFQHYSVTPLYNTKRVVHKTGVPADTFRAWERRYGVPQPYRDQRNQRLYSEQDVALICWLRDRTAEGLTASQAVALLHTADAVPPDYGQSRPVAALQNDLLQVLLQFDATRSDRVLSEAFALYPLDIVCLDIIQPTLIELGAMWEEGGTPIVAHEHFSSSFIRRKLLTLLNTYDLPEARATIVAACVPGEQHELGLMVLALLLTRRMYRVVYLGADLPIDALRHTIADVRPHMVCISATQRPVLEQALSQLATLRSDAPDLLIVVGGQAIADYPPKANGVHFLSEQDASALDAIERLVATHHRAPRRDAEVGT